MKITTTFNRDNFGMQWSKWFPVSWNHFEEAPKVQSKNWSCFHADTFDPESVVANKEGNSKLLVSGIYCFIKEGETRFKNVCIVIIEQNRNRDEWSYGDGSVVVEDGIIVDCDKSSEYSLREALREFYDAGYEMGSSCFDDYNLHDAPEGYSTYLDSLTDKAQAVSYAEWLEDEFQLHTSEDQFPEYEYDWSPRDKFAGFIDWDVMSNEYYRGSEAAHDYYMNILSGMTPVEFRRFMKKKEDHNGEV